MSTAAYPLKLRPIYKEKVWGGRTLEEKLGRELPGGSDAKIGESWELVDLAATSASGGGGDAAFSVIDNGPLAGRTLHEVLGEPQAAREILRDLPRSKSGGFPILLKYLDASENLSVQVHPSPAYAEAHPDAKLKSEAWYIVATEPGARIYKGITAGTTPAAPLVGAVTTRPPAAFSSLTASANSESQSLVWVGDGALSARSARSCE